MTEQVPPPSVQDMSLREEDLCLPFCRPDKACNAVDCPYVAPTAVDDGAAASPTIVSDSGHQKACPAACESVRSCCICRHSCADKKDSTRRRRSRRILGALKPSCFAGKKAPPKQARLEPDTVGSRSATAEGRACGHLALGTTTSLSMLEQDQGRCYCCPCVNRLYQHQVWARSASQSAVMLPFRGGAGVTSRPEVEIPKTGLVLSPVDSNSWPWDGNVSSATFAIMVILSVFAVSFTFLVVVSLAFF